MVAIGHCQLLIGKLQLLEYNQGGWVGSGQCSIAAQTPFICIIKDPESKGLKDLLKDLLDISSLNSSAILEHGLDSGH